MNIAQLASFGLYTECISNGARTKQVNPYYVVSKRHRPFYLLHSSCGVRFVHVTVPSLLPVPSAFARKVKAETFCFAYVASLHVLYFLGEMSKTGKMVSHLILSWVALGRFWSHG